MIQELRKQNIQNLNIEKEGIIILRELVTDFIVPSKEQKVFLYNILDIDYKKYFNTPDKLINLLNINQHIFDELSMRIYDFS